MKLSVDVDRRELDALLAEFPKDMRASMDLFVDRVGYKLDNESKKAAPVKSGNLRRMIWYFDKTTASFLTNQAAGEVVAHANYAKYVHGEPFHRNRMRRKETPFFTNALANSETFIKTEAKAMINRVLK